MTHFLSPVIVAIAKQGPSIFGLGSSIELNPRAACVPL